MAQPRKSLGQHWLNNEDSLKSIVKSARLSSDDVVLEIGPGPGSLTKLLLEESKKVVAVEIDERFITILNQKFSDEKLQLISQDIREFNLTSLPANYKVVANIPYYLTNFLIQLLVTSANPPDSITLLIQKEVAQRLASQPGQHSLLSLSTQLFGQVELGQIVEAKLFEPPPKVDSQIVHIKRQNVNNNQYENKKLWRLIKAGFSTKRKKLSNNLAALLELDKTEIEAILSKLNLGKNIRAQELSIEDWTNLYTKMIMYL